MVTIATPAQWRYDWDRLLMVVFRSMVGVAMMAMDDTAEPELSEWAEQMIRRVEILVRHGRPLNAHIVIRELASHGLTHKPTPDPITPDTWVVGAFDYFTSGLLESHGLHRVRHVAQLSRAALLSIPMLGKSRADRVLKILADHLPGYVTPPDPPPDDLEPLAADPELADVFR